jgi:beta-galactosidase
MNLDATVIAIFYYIGGCLKMKTLQTDKVKLGVCYYPEHWDESLWEDDFRRMRELGFSVVRMAEFAWTIMEPEEGSFQFDLFDRALDTAHRHGLKVILGTPTATPPVWLTTQYPEVLNASREGVLYRHGMRRHYNYNSEVYRQFCARITRKMAEHFKDHPAVIGWQIDNELNCEINVFYSAADHAAFREWLKQRYGTLQALNRAWGTVFWNQTYTDWEQVHLTLPTPSNSTNPHQALDEKRFISDSAIGFARIQADILREVVGSRHFITTNGMFGHLDNHRLTDEVLDFYSYDSYPLFGYLHPDEGQEPFLDRMWSLNLSTVRSISPNFCVMEQQSGPGGWANGYAMPSPKPGQMRLWTYQSIAHGADMVLYFRWRTAIFGTEIYWHGINDYHNQPNRRIEEARRVGQELNRIADRLAGSRCEASIAIVSDYDNEWDGELDRWFGPLAARSMRAWFKTLQREHVAVDRLVMTERTTLNDLKRYRVLVYPHPAILTETMADLLREYVEAGGILLFGARTGYKDEHGQCRMMPLPGYATALSGVRVEDFTAVSNDADSPNLRWLANETDDLATTTDLRAMAFNDILRVESDRVQIIAEYASDYYAGKPALTVHTVGEGQVYYYGAVYTEAVVRKLLPRLGLQRIASDLVQAPAEVELVVRRHPASGETFIFALNYTNRPAQLRMLRPAVDLLTDRSLSTDVALEPYGVLVLV